MIKWREIDYKRRNKLLFVGAGILLVLAWFLAFQKTYQAYRENNRLHQLIGRDISNSTQYDFERRSKVLDSLSNVYQTDSAVWSDNFLSEASRAVNSPQIQVYFNNAVRNTMQADTVSVKSKSLIVKGDYRAIVSSVAELEKINTLGYLSTVTLKMDNRRTSTNERKVIEGEVGFKVKIEGYR
ncbi:hypothetical protein K7A41_07755 [Sphingobacterium sp. InxBP1]|uniref:hypothetical protein n=1 Tax=Sphingobacterium sp. InxBP1 TaxID=2870328 RepID=UPI00224479A6|nr:hypothetical protein [Sphingobacterium sp. InxBP1]MCW8311113.1 hypothetical protein [Sphingobacterium sp. InxBP1]